MGSFQYKLQHILNEGNIQGGSGFCFILQHKVNTAEFKKKIPNDSVPYTLDQKNCSITLWLRTLLVLYKSTIIWSWYPTWHGPDFTCNYMFKWWLLFVMFWFHTEVSFSWLAGNRRLRIMANDKVTLRGHLGVPDSVSGPLIVPLNYLVILHLNHQFSWKMYRFKGIPSTWLQKLYGSYCIGIVHFRPPDVPLRIFLTKSFLVICVRLLTTLGPTVVQSWPFLKVDLGEKFNIAF